MGIGGSTIITTSTIHGVFKGARPESLPELCLDLLARQKETWPMARAGFESLRLVREKELSCGGFAVRVQHNPGRIKSTLADVGEEGVAGRACFLCPENLPSGQKGILYRDELLILCNPMPVFSPHFTVSSLDHRPQSLIGSVDALLMLMSDFGPGSAILYNGPRCGASAPDHFHFQVVPSEPIPILGEIHAGQGASRKTAGGVSVRRAGGVGRSVVVLEGVRPAALGSALDAFVRALQAVLLTDIEPMMNLICVRESHTYRVLLFPRAKHRPDAFYLEGERRMAISPAVVEMGGIIVAPLERDFERLDSVWVEQIFKEVSLPAEIVEQAVGAME